MPNSARRSGRPSRSRSDLAGLAPQIVAELARRHLLDFTTLTFPGFAVARHHEAICEWLEDVECGDRKRVIVTLPPRHTKSELVSKRFPAWYLGRHPERQVIGASYAAELAYTFSHEARNILVSPQWPFPDVALAGDRKSVKQWATSAGGKYVSAGVGGPITGHGAHLFLIDDPIKNAEEADSEVYREKVWSWYTSTARTRLMPDAAIVLVLCMTGDTPVLMADGTEIPLREIKVGDRVATYDNGVLATSTVRNHKSNGHDSVFRIMTTSGKIVHANERHPFLVEEHGQLRWIRLRYLTTAHRIVTVKDSGASGKERLAPWRVATNLLARGATALRITAQKCGQMGIVLRQSMQKIDAACALSAGMESPPQSMLRCLKRKMANALYASNRLETTYAHIGAGSYASTIATKLAPSEGSCATTVTLPWDMPRRKQPHSPLPNTSGFTTEGIAKIEPAGIREVFDIQVERTENFIANGLVSHNTRWHEDDLAGRLIAAQSAGGERWDVLSLPALAEEGDPLGRPEGAPLWPEWYDLDALAEIRQATGGRVWSALYQQRPTPIEGALIKPAWWQTYAEAPRMDRVVHVWDTAHKKGTANDYSVCAMWGRARTGYYLLDLWRDKVEYPQLKQMAIAFHEARRPNAVLIEDTSAGVSLIQELRQTTRIPILPVKVDKDKVARVNSVSPTIEAGKVYVPERAPWLADFLREHAEFPNGAHDDMVDTTTMALAYLRVGHRVDGQPTAAAIAKPEARPPALLPVARGGKSAILIGGRR